uniref:Uncharacterized protein n=1 Tax=Chenopodium quinoa TaxID=63459 RepID=A0A803LWU1_CHEQI
MKGSSGLVASILAASTVPLFTFPSQLQENASFGAQSSSSSMGKEKFSPRFDGLSLVIKTFTVRLGVPCPGCSLEHCLMTRDHMGIGEVSVGILEKIKNDEYALELRILVNLECLDDFKVIVFDVWPDQC